MQSKAKKAMPEMKGSAILTQSVINFNPGYLLKGGTMYPLSADFVGSKPPVERNFKSEYELSELAMKNKRVLFGQDCFIFPVPKEHQQTAPHFFMLDLGAMVKPRVYFVDIMHSPAESFEYLLFRTTHLFLHEKENMETMLKLAQKSIAVSNALRLRGKLSKQDIINFFQVVGAAKPTILLLSDGTLNGLSELERVYPLWRNVKAIVLKKYASNGDTLCTMTPAFSEIHLNGKQKVNGVPVTEEEHLSKVMPEVKDMFQKIKAELMKANSKLLWNSQKHYIALKSSRKIAVFQFSRKKMTIVVMQPETAVKAAIRHYEIKTLTAKVQKFWNGESCTIVVDNAVHLDEVIKLLKKQLAS